VFGVIIATPSYIMSDLAKWKVHGSVATLRVERATWDDEGQGWKPEPYFTETSFRRDGAISSTESHNPNGSIAHSQWLYDVSGRLTESDSWMNKEAPQRTLYIYDEGGRHIRTTYQKDDGTQTDLELCSYDAEGKGTKTRMLPVSAVHEGGAVSLGYSIEDTDMALGAPGATSMTTSYVGPDKPAKVILEDTNHNTVTEVHFVRDAQGRLQSVETLMGDSQFKDFVDRGSPERREAMAAFFKQAFGDAFSRTTYKYDSQGHLIEKINTMGTMHEEHTTYGYDGVHDEAIEETTETRSRGATLEDGAIHYNPDTVSTQHNRFEYRYDTHGNWTEQIVSGQYDPSADFQRSNVERRTLTYYE
jgi:YD repeat-containing protein